MLVPQTALQVGHIDQVAHFLDFVGGHELRLNPHREKDGSHVFDVFPTCRVCGKDDAASPHHADILTAFTLNFFVESNRVGLETGNVEIVIQRVKAPGSMPGGACGQLRSLNQYNVVPTKFCKMIEDAGADHSAAYNYNTIMTFHWMRLSSSVWIVLVSKAVIITHINSV